MKKGVVAPMAWLNDTGMNRRLMFPPTTDATKTTARTATLMACRRDLRFCRGAMPAVRTAKARVAHMPRTMCIMVRKMGNLNPHTERRYLFSRMTPILLKYHAAIITTVYAFVLTTAGEEGGKGRRGGTSARENRRSGPAAGRATIWTRVGSRARRSRRGRSSRGARTVSRWRPASGRGSRSSTVLSGPPTGPGSQASPVAEETRQMVPLSAPTQKVTSPAS